MSIRRLAARFHELVESRGLSEAKDKAVQIHQAAAKAMASTLKGHQTSLQKGNGYSSVSMPDGSNIMWSVEHHQGTDRYTVELRLHRPLSPTDVSDKISAVVGKVVKANEAEFKSLYNGRVRLRGGWVWARGDVNEEGLGDVEAELPRLAKRLGSEIDKGLKKALK